MTKQLPAKAESDEVVEQASGRPTRPCAVGYPAAFEYARPSAYSQQSINVEQWRGEPLCPGVRFFAPGP